MNKDKTCKQLLECKDCPNAAEDFFSYRSKKRGTHLPLEKCTQNCMIFVLNGELLINSEEYPGVILKENDFVLQAMGSKIELLSLTDTNYLVLHFNELPLICKTRYNKIINDAKEPTIYTPLRTESSLKACLNSVVQYIETDSSHCAKYLKLKAQEIFFLIINNFEAPQLNTFLYPISNYTESFHYFIIQNYNKVKSVEEFARLGGYNVNTFRRLFKNIYNEPVYEWILNKKREGILDDLQNSKDKINLISSKYGFDSLSHFAHFCKSSFGDTPRSIRSRFAKGETISIINK